MASELTAAERWLTNILKGDATINNLVGGRVYTTEVPDTAPYPVILITLLSPSPDTCAIPNIRVLASMLYTVRAVVEGTSTIAAESIADRLDQILQDNSGSNVAGIIGSSVREMPFYMPERATVGSLIKHYRHLGGIYKLIVQGV